MKNITFFLASLLFTSCFANAQTLPKPDHIVILLDENRNYSEIVGNHLAPYINSLLKDTNTAIFSDAHALESGSQPNYLQLFSGSSQGVVGSNITPVQFTDCNLGASLIAGSYTFIGYAESLPYLGYLGADSGNYARKHNPWSNWQGTSTNQLPASTNQPFTSFPVNYDLLPTVSFVVPNLIDDMHTPSDSTSIKPGDTWLQNNLNGYIQWAKTHNSLFIFGYDESSTDPSEQILVFFTGQNVKGGYYSEPVEWYRILHTMEEMYNLPYCASSDTSSSITNVWSSVVFTGLKENAPAENSLEISPVPAHGTLNIHINYSTNDKQDISIIDPLGRVVKTDEAAITVGENKLTMDIQNIPTGIYFIKVSGKNMNSCRKIIIEH